MSHGLALISVLQTKQKIIEKHDMSDLRQDYGLNTAFIEEIEEMFEVAGLPWSERPLVPIQSQARPAQD